MGVKGSNEDEHSLVITDDEMLVLDAFFDRLLKGKSGEELLELEQLLKGEDTPFAHPAELIALLRLAGQFERSVRQIFDPEYKKLLDEARGRLADGWES